MEPTIPHAFENLGAIPSVKDKRDHYILGTAGAYDFPATKSKIQNRPIYFQGHRPACGAHSAAALKTSLDLQAGKTDVLYNPREIWINIKKDGTSPSDGTSYTRVFNVLKTTGVVPFSPLGNEVTYDDADYAAQKFLTPDILAEEGKNIIAATAFLQDQTFEGIKQAIHDFGAVIIEFDVCARLWTAADGRISWQAADILPLAPPDANWPVVSRHFMVADYYDENYFYGANSFGNTWGLAGEFQMGRDYLPHITRVGVLHNPTKPVIAPTPAQIVQQELPQVTEMVQHLTTLPPEVRAAHPDWFTQLETILANMMASISGK